MGDVYLRQGDVTSAIKVLSGVKKSNTGTVMYQKVQAKLADILLTYKNDRFEKVKTTFIVIVRESFISIHRSLAESASNSGKKGQKALSLVRLGDAFLRVKEVEEAMHTYFEV
jgi:lipopolysaccharide biosynthesis regulator YciM